MKMRSINLCLVLAAVLSLAGCGPKDGSRELADGNEAYALNDFAKARKLYSEALVRSPQNVDALVSLARVDIDLGEMEEAEKTIHEAEKYAADDLDVRELGAQIAWHREQYSRARELYRGIANEMRLDAKTRSLGWTGLGIVEMSCDNSHLSRVALLTAIRLDYSSPSAWYHLALLYRDGFGYYEAALDAFNIYVRLAKEASPRVQKVQRVVIPTLKDTITHATASRPGVSSRNSENCASQLVKAEAALKKGDLKVARLRYQDALRADVLSYPAALGLAKTIQRVDSSAKGISDALSAYKTACTLRPSAISSFLSAGELATRGGHHAQAREFYSRALAADPANMAALDGLIRAMKRLGGSSAEIKAYQSYRDSLPKLSKRK